MTLQLLHKEKREDGNYQSIDPSNSCLEELHFEAKHIMKGDTWVSNTENHEYCIVLISGDFEIRTDKGNWRTGNGRKSVFDGIAYSLYLPRRTQFEIIANQECELAIGWVATDQDFDPIFRKPGDCEIELRGGGNASRQINSLLPPGSACHKLVCVEVYTPAGNWSSYPPHKHDERVIGEDGELLEADLEEIYFYKMSRPEGYAFQKIYTADRRIDQVLEAKNNDVIIVPEGYHPVVAGHGYDVYYLNFLVGSDQSLANSDDPEHQWIKDTWKDLDPRLPMVSA